MFRQMFHALPVLIFRLVVWLLVFTMTLSTNISDKIVLNHKRKKNDGFGKVLKLNFYAKLKFYEIVTYLSLYIPSQGKINNLSTSKHKAHVVFLQFDKMCYEKTSFKVLA